MLHLTRYLDVLSCRFGRLGTAFHIVVFAALGSKVAVQVIAWDAGIIPDAVRVVLGLALLLLFFMWLAALDDLSDMYNVVDEHQVPFDNVRRFYVGWCDSYWTAFKPFRPSTWASPAFKTGAQADLSMGAHSQILHPTLDQPAAN